MSGGLDGLVERYSLPPEARIRLRSLAEMLSREDRAPTAIRDPERVLLDHLADSLVGLEVPQLASPSSIVDIGAGAGLPGLPLAIALPGAVVALVESNARKCAFIEEAVVACDLPNARAVCERVEAWTDGLGRADVVTARALAPLAVLAEYAAPLLRVGGVLVAWRGQRDGDAEVEAQRAAAQLGLRVEPPVRVEPYQGAEHRHLHVMLKLSETPARFPRRVGVARKSPLGAA